MAGSEKDATARVSRAPATTEPGSPLPADGKSMSRLPAPAEHAVRNSTVGALPAPEAPGTDTSVAPTLGDPQAVRRCLEVTAAAAQPRVLREPLGFQVATFLAGRERDLPAVERRRTPAFIRALFDDGILPCPRRSGEKPIRTLVASVRDDRPPHSP